MTNSPNIEDLDVVYPDPKTWFLTTCPSADCKQLWYFSHEIENIEHNVDGTHSFSYDGNEYRQAEFELNNEE